MEFIDLQAQYRAYKTNIDTRIRAVLDHGKFIMGPEISEMEQKLAEYVGIDHCISVSNGTQSLEIALRAMDIGPGDEVITVPFTWISSAEVILLVGARPVFVDIDSVSFNIDVTQIEKTISPRTKAILAVSLFGQMPDFSEINRIAERHGIMVIEDAAQSFGATQRGRRSCSVTPISSTSFFPAKPLGCYGDGGALFTSDSGFADKMRAIRTHGGLVRHHHPYVGTNGRMDTLQAAIVLAKFEHFEWEVQERERIGREYTDALQNVCRAPQVMPGNTHVYAQYTLTTPYRDQLQKILKEKGIPSAIYYPKCLHEQPVFQHLGYQWGDFPNAERASRQVLSLPMHPFLNPEDRRSIIAEVTEGIRQIELPPQSIQ